MRKASFALLVCCWSPVALSAQAARSVASADEIPRTVLERLADDHPAATAFVVADTLSPCGIGRETIGPEYFDSLTVAARDALASCSATPSRVWPRDLRLLSDRPVQLQSDRGRFPPSLDEPVFVISVEGTDPNGDVAVVHAWYYCGPRCARRMLYWYRSSEGRWYFSSREILGVS